MKHNVYLLLILFAQFNYSQEIKKEIKTYKGPYENYYKDGYAEYEYYENSDLERIFNGKFEFSTQEKSLIKGQYLENKKNGYWSYFINRKDNFSRVILESYGNYTEGRKNGEWTYKFDSYISHSVKVYQPDIISNIENFKYVINFKNDTLVGKLNIMDVEKWTRIPDFNGGDIGLSGEFDDNGRFTGVWERSKEEGKEFIIEFYRGFLIKYINRNLETGEFNDKYIPNKEKIIKKIDELIVGKVPLVVIETAFDNFENDINKDFYAEKYDFGCSFFNSFDGFLVTDISKILGLIKTQFTPNERREQNQLREEYKFYYKKPKILYKSIEGTSSFKVYKATE